MRILVVGSVALDTIETPDGVHSDLLGGSASYFSLAATHFSTIGLVAVVGDDFPPTHLELLAARGIGLEGLERRPGRSFRWTGVYGADLQDRRTLRTELGVFEDFHPVLPAGTGELEALFLANIDPDLQKDVLQRVGPVPLVAVDTMNFWIEGKPLALADVIRSANLLLINDEEALLLTGLKDLVQAAKRIRESGPEAVVIKKGLHGVLALGPWGWLALPALPLSAARDTTGAGDSFAGGLIGYLAGRNWRDRACFATGLAVGTAIASIAVESYGVNGLATDRRGLLAERYARLRQLTHFDLPPAAAGE